MSLREQVPFFEILSSYIYSYIYIYVDCMLEHVTLHQLSVGVSVCNWLLQGALQELKVYKEPAEAENFDCDDQVHLTISSPG